MCSLLIRWVLFAGILVFPVRVAADSAAYQALQRFADRVYREELPNGVTVLMYPRPGAPLFAGVTSVRVGGVDEPDGLTGGAHLFEHMAFKGTPDLGSKDYPKEAQVLEAIEDLAAETAGGTKLTEETRQHWERLLSQAAALSNSRLFDQLLQIRGANGLNATTDSELTNYFVNLPKNSFEFWCWLESERLIRPVLREFYQERDVVMEERRMRFDDDPLGKLYEQFIARAFAVHPYRRPVIGYVDDIRTLTARRVEHFRKVFYVGRNIVVSVVGDLDPKRDMATVRRYFSRVPDGADPPRPAQLEPRQTAERRFVLRGHGEPVVLLGYKSEPYPHPDNAALTLLGEVLTGARRSPMIEVLVRERRLATSVAFSEEPGYSYPNLAMFLIKVAPGKTPEQALSAFDAVVTNVLRQGITEQQLVVARRAVLVDTLGGFSSNLGLARLLSATEQIYGDWRLMVEFIHQLDHITPELVIDAARRYLVPSARTVGIYKQGEPTS